jgi:hypothetical protein
MAETARFVLIDGEMFIEEQQFPEEADLALPIERCATDLAESVGFNAIDLRYDSRHILIE